ncbi:hypothetical protein HPB50_026352 [Hyalomma asiaticum]|uniref:Uncharacterized protein n=1 Tax=Hyalomma asiaticum TaxID=266040 RepID=A0ACB7T051_HYAAI|nr:hypothetical protein HPB50_026352 [Hyalomma asiaticum]
MDLATLSVCRAYRVQNEGSLACFVAAALAMFLLLCLVAYFFFGHGAAVLTRPRGSVPGPVMSCYYDPAWSNATERGAWAYDLTQHFHTDTCTHAVFVGVEYGYRGITLPEYVSDSLANFLTLKRPGLPVLVSVMVQDVAGASSNPEQFAVIVVDWAIRNSFDGVELDMPEDTAARGYDALAQALSMQMALATQLWILSANVYTTASFVNQVDLQQLHRAVDFLVLNTQSLARNDQVTSAHSPLYGNNSWNSTLGMVYASTNTMSRLVPVVPFMSREFELRDALPHATMVTAGIKCRGLAAKTQYHSSPGVRAFFEMLFIAANRLLGVALKQLGLDTIRASQECGPKDTLFTAVANEFRQLQRSGDGKLPWKSRHVRLTVVRESGRTACVGAV